MAAAGSARVLLRATQRQSLLCAASTSAAVATPASSSSSSRAYTAEATRPKANASSSRTAAAEKRIHTSRTLLQDRQGKEHSQQRSGPAYNVRLTPPAAKDIQSIQKWLRDAFPATPFPDNVAMQLITHESFDHGSEAGHNRRLAFVGRRALTFYMSLFLAERAPQTASSTKIKTLLQTSRLGDGPGRALKLAEVMRWTPAINDGQLGPKETGLFKIRGVTVEALLGAVYHQQGAQAARSFFRAEILPHIDTFERNERDALRSAISEERRIGQAHLQAMAAGIGPAGEAESGLSAEENASNDVRFDASQQQEQSSYPSSGSSASTANSLLHSRRRSAPANRAPGTFEEGAAASQSSAPGPAHSPST